MPRPSRRTTSIAIITLVVTLVILGIIPGPHRQGAEIIIDPAQLLNQAGSTWTAKVYVNSTTSVNSVDTTIHYNSDLVQVQGISIDQADYDMPVFQPQHDPAQATIRFTETTLNPRQGLSLVGQVEFKGLKQGNLVLSHSQTKIIAADGQGTNLYVPRLRQSILMWLIRLTPWVN